MAQRVEVILVDDIDGGDAVETVVFSVDGTAYEIDLSAANAQKLRDDFATWTGHARRSSGGARKSAAGVRRARRSDLAQIREWARSKGHKVSDRGRVSADIQKAYDDAHN